MTNAERTAVCDNLDRLIDATRKTLTRASKDSGINLESSSQAVVSVLASARVLVAGAVTTDGAAQGLAMPEAE
jgi:hypothetical protein